MLAASVDGLAFAHRHGFVETERFEVDGVAFNDLTLQEATMSVPSGSHHRIDRERAAPEATEFAAETQSTPQLLSLGRCRGSAWRGEMWLCALVLP